MLSTLCRWHPLAPTSRSAPTLLAPADAYLNVAALTPPSPQSTTSADIATAATGPIQPEPELGLMDTTFFSLCRLAATCTLPSSPISGFRPTSGDFTHLRPGYLRLDCVYSPTSSRPGLQAFGAAISLSPDPLISGIAASLSPDRLTQFLDPLISPWFATSRSPFRPTSHSSVNDQLLIQDPYVSQSPSSR